jgi:hypothetical protein
MWYICKDNLDLVIWSLNLFYRIVRGDSRAGDLKGKAFRRLLPVDLATMSHGERSSKLLKYTALASRVFRILMDGARVVEMTPAVPTVWCLGSRFDLDLALHVMERYVNCNAQAKRHVGG